MFFLAGRQPHQAQQTGDGGDGAGTKEEGRQGAHVDIIIAMLITTRNYARDDRDVDHCRNARNDRDVDHYLNARDDRDAHLDHENVHDERDGDQDDDNAHDDRDADHDDENAHDDPDADHDDENARDDCGVDHDDDNAHMSAIDGRLHVAAPMCHYGSRLLVLLWFVKRNPFGI